MANYQRTGTRARQRQQAARRLKRIIIAGTAGAVLLAALVVLLALPKGDPDPTGEALARPEATAAVAQGEPLVAQGEPLVAQGETSESEDEPPTTQATPTPQAQESALSSMSSRAATRPTPTAPGYGLVFSKANTEEKIIAITVDDCYQADNLQQIVDKALEVGGKLTLFPIGQNVLREKQSQILKYAWEQGFELENHTFTHNGLFAIDDAQMAEEVYKQQLAISYILGVEYQCHFLRPKGGDARKDQRMQVYAEQLGYYGIAHWSCAGSTSTEKEIAKALHPGAIYLFHTTTENDLDKLLNFMPYAVEQGYQLVTLNEMFGYPENETRPLDTPISEHTIPQLEPYAVYYDVYKPTRYSWGAYLLQKKLIELGYLKGEPDGVFGKGCAASVKAFQKDHGMEQTGVADVATQEAIFGVPTGTMTGQSGSA